MKKIKTFFLGLIAALGLTSCGLGSETAFVEQKIVTKVEESSVVVTLPKKTEEETTDVKGYFQVKIRDVQISLKAFVEEDENEVEKPLQTISLHLEDDADRFVNAAYEKAFALLNLETGDGEELHYKLLDSEIGTPFHKGVGLKFKIILEELAKINSYEILKDANYFTLTVKDITRSPYSIIANSRPVEHIDMLWDGEAFIKKEVEQDPTDPGEGTGSEETPTTDPEDSGSEE